MTIRATVVLDSKAPNGARLTTFELTYPRFIHAELMTHRVFSRNAASSRAIPTPKKIERIRKDCARPSEWGVNQKGMQSSGELSSELQGYAFRTWEHAKIDALFQAEILCGLRCARCEGEIKEDGLCAYVTHPDGSRTQKQQCIEAGFPIKLDLHKQVANRILEPFDHITTVVSTTKLNNHWKLRCDAAADPTYQELAHKWKAAFDASTPKLLEVGQWHLPYVQWEDWLEVGKLLGKSHAAGCEWERDWHACNCGALDVIPVLKKISTGRVARTSYMRQGQGDVAANVELHDRLASSGHWSPFEAVATPIPGIRFGGNEGLPYECDRCGVWIDVGAKYARLEALHPICCMKCALGHVTSGNFVGWHQYRKGFPGEAGGD